MQEMSDALTKAGHDFHFVVINAEDAQANVQNLIDKCVMPVFQDTKGVNAWGKHDGSKDDFYVYDAKGKLFAWLPFGGKVNTDLSSSEGYGNLNKALLDASLVK